MATARYVTESHLLTAHEATLVKALDLVPAGARSLDVTLMDTFDGRLVRDGGIVLRTALADDRWELRWLSTALDADRGRLVVDGSPNPTRDDLPPGPVAARLGRVLDVRALLPLAHVRGEVRHFEKRDRRGKVVLRLRLDPGLVVHTPATRRRVELPPQLHVFGLLGFDRAFATARDAAGRLRGAETAATPWAVDALRAAGHEPGRDPSEVSITLRPDMTPRAALRAICGAYLRVLRTNREGARAALDPEFLHDFRVAIRRTRTVLKASRDHWPPALVDRFREDFRWLARETSPVRDLDVYLLDFEDFRDRLPAGDRAALDPVRTWLESENAVARRRLADVLAGGRASALLDDWSALLASRGFANDGGRDGPDAASLAADLVDRAHRRVLRDGRRIDENSPDQALHDLRKRAKELRYLIDGFRSLFDEKVARRQIKALKRLQDNLGLHQDRVVQSETLRRIAEDLEEAPASTLVALGYLIEQLEQDAQRLRDEFAARFADYDGKARRRALENALEATRQRSAKAAR